MTTRHTRWSGRCCKRCVPTTSAWPQRSTRSALNGTSSTISFIGVGLDGGDRPDEPGVTTTAEDLDTAQLAFPDLGEWRDALYARIVEKVGDRRYMEHWAEDISQIAAAQETRIRGLVEHTGQNPAAVARFDEFLTALRHNLNDSVTADDAIQMLSQHLITRPIFDALFGGGKFAGRNPVSQVMQAMIETLRRGRPRCRDRDSR